MHHGPAQPRVYNMREASKLVGFDPNNMMDEAEWKEMMAQYDMIRTSQMRLKRQGRAMMEDMMNDLGIEGDIIQD